MTGCEGGHIAREASEKLVEWYVQPGKVNRTPRGESGGVECPRARAHGSREDYVIDRTLSAYDCGGSCHPEGGGRRLCTLLTLEVERRADHLNSTVRPTLSRPSRYVLTWRSAWLNAHPR